MILPDSPAFLGRGVWLQVQRCCADSKGKTSEEEEEEEEEEETWHKECSHRCS